MDRVETASGNVPQIVLMAREMNRQGMNYADIARELDRARSTVRQWCTRVRFGHLHDGKIYHARGEEQDALIRRARRYRAKGLSYQDIAVLLQKSAGSVRMYCLGLTFDRKAQKYIPLKSRACRQPQKTRLSEGKTRLFLNARNAQVVSLRPYAAEPSICNEDIARLVAGSGR